MSVDTDTPVLGAGNETSWTCPRRRIEYGGNQIFVKISSRFCLLWWVIPPVRGNGSNDVDWQVLTTAKP